MTGGGVTVFAFDRIKSGGLGANAPLCSGAWSKIGRGSKSRDSSVGFARLRPCAPPVGRAKIGKIGRGSKFRDSSFLSPLRGAGWPGFPPLFDISSRLLRNRSLMLGAESAVLQPPIRHI